MNLFARLAPLRRTLVAPLPLVGLLAAVGPLALSAGSVDRSTSPAEAVYRSLPELPEGSVERGRDGVEHSAIALAASLRAVPIDALGADCPSSDLAVSWAEPDPGFDVGAHVTPIGPAPTATTTSVNGIVVCTGFDYGYMGFEAQWAGSRWDVVAVPFVGEGEEEHLAVQPAQAIPQGPKPVPVLAAPGTVTGPIEGYAAYEPQRMCDASAKVGTKSLAGALLRDYPVSRNLGIVRGCGVGGRSEHKEGRAFDWGVNITNPNEKAAAEAFISALLATDADGNANALARRMGVYVRHLQPPDLELLPRARGLAAVLRCERAPRPHPHLDVVGRRARAHVVLVRQGAARSPGRVAEHLDRRVEPWDREQPRAQRRGHDRVIGWLARCPR